MAKTKRFEAQERFSPTTEQLEAIVGLATEMMATKSTVIRMLIQEALSARERAQQSPEARWPQCDCGRPVSEHHEAFTRKLCAECLLTGQHE